MGIPFRLLYWSLAISKNPCFNDDIICRVDPFLYIILHPESFLPHIRYLFTPIFFCFRAIAETVCPYLPRACGMISQLPKCADRRIPDELFARISFAWSEKLRILFNFLKLRNGKRRKSKITMQKCL